MTITGDSGSDEIKNCGSNVTISGDLGDDFIENGYWDSNSHRTIYGGENITITGGEGNDTIENDGSKATISGGSGNDYISNITYDYSHDFPVSLSGDAGDDILSNDSSNSTILGGTGNDTISNYAENVLMTGGAGNDEITNRGNNVTINGGAGNDSIYNSYDVNSVTIAGGKGNDYVSLNSDSKNAVIQYASDNGNDTIVGFKSGDTLHITKGSYTTTKSGDDFIVNVGKDTLRLKDALADSYNKIAIKDSKGNVKIYNDWKKWNGSIRDNYATNVTLAGSSENDTISNYAENVLITGDAGNDEITNYQGNKVTIAGDAGNDYISNYGDKVTISGGAGNDSIYSDGDYSTILGGAGDDFIGLYSYAENTVMQYASGDGNDTIVGFNSDDTLHITKGSYSTVVSGNDVIVKVGKGTITLKYVALQNISIKDSKCNVKTFSANVSELWFDDEENLAQIDSITQNGLANYSLGNVEVTTDWKALNPNDSLTSGLTYSDK